MELKQKSTMENNKYVAILQQCRAINAFLMKSYDMRLDDPSRKRRAVEVRAATAYALYEAGYTLKQIGLALSKDHSTIIHLRSKFEAEMGQSDFMREVYEGISALVSQSTPVAEDPMRKLTMENEMLRKQLAGIANEESRFKDIFALIKERTPVGAEEEVKKRLNWMLNTVNEQLRRA